MKYARNMMDGKTVIANYIQGIPNMLGRSKKEFAVVQRKLTEVMRINFLPHRKTIPKKPRTTFHGSGNV